MSNHHYTNYHKYGPICNCDCHSFYLVTTLFITPTALQARILRKQWWIPLGHMTHAFQQTILYFPAAFCFRSWRFWHSKNRSGGVTPLSRRHDGLWCSSSAKSTHGLILWRLSFAFGQDSPGRSPPVTTRIIDYIKQVWIWYIHARQAYCLSYSAEKFEIISFSIRSAVKNNSQPQSSTDLHELWSSDHGVTQVLDCTNFEYHCIFLKIWLSARKHDSHSYHVALAVLKGDQYWSLPSLCCCYRTKPAGRSCSTSGMRMRVRPYVDEGSIPLLFHPYHVALLTTLIVLDLTSILSSPDTQSCKSCTCIIHINSFVTRAQETCHNSDL